RLASLRKLINPEPRSAAARSGAERWRRGMTPSPEQQAPAHHPYQTTSISDQQQQQGGNGALDAGTTDTPPSARGALGLWDAVSIIVGIVVGAGIYQTAPDILGMSGSPQVALTAWAIGGLLSFIGALCYAELATTYPRDGGDIVYLSRAFGRWVGFQFGWVQLTVILTGSIGMMAFVFANYSIRLFKDAFGLELGVLSAFGFAGGAVLA